MKLVDTNVLLYAVDSTSRHHDASRNWLDGALAGTETIAFSWLALAGFIRIGTNPRVFARPLTTLEAVEQTETWVGASPARVLEPGPGHLASLRRLLEPLGTAGNLVSDAHLAAIALEHRATIVTYDNDFDRFAGVRWQRPA